LENHGVLAFGADPAAAARANLIVEEAAQMAIYAEVLGGAKAIPPEMLKRRWDGATSLPARARRERRSS
jgi:ribulose-5-phosphate 4-epimerase/fuculose-1-phosphate aldolase